MWDWNIDKIICIFKWYIPLHFILHPGENTSSSFFFSFLIFFFLLRPVLQLHTSKTCSPALKAEPLLQELSPHFQKSHIIECFFNMVAVSKHLGTAFRARPLPTVGSGWSKKKKKTSQVKFKDVFLLEAGPCCYKPKETFSCSTFFMVSPRVSSLPSSLHLGSTVTYCCTGCRPRPAGHHRREWGVGRGCRVQFQPYGSRTEVLVWLICSDSGERAAWTAMTSGFSHHPLPVMHSPKTQSRWPTVTSQELGVLPPTALVLMWPPRKTS